VKAIPKTPIYFPIVVLFVVLGAIVSAARIIFLAIISVPFAIYATLKEVYHVDAE